MADFLHQREHLHSEDNIILECNTECNFMILTDTNFKNYKAKKKYEYYGGVFKKSPSHIVVPNTGFWNIVIHPAETKAELRYSLSFIKVQKES